MLHTHHHNHNKNNIKSEQYTAAYTQWYRRCKYEAQQHIEIGSQAMAMLSKRYTLHISHKFVLVVVALVSDLMTCLVPKIAQLLKYWTGNSSNNDNNNDKYHRCIVFGTYRIASMWCLVSTVCTIQESKCACSHQRVLCS